MDLDIPSLSGDKKLCLSKSGLPEKDRGRDGNKGPGCLGSEHGEDLRLASALVGAASLSVTGMWILKNLKH